MPITDAGLLQLAELRQLQELSIIGANATDDGLKGLQAALSNCVIHVQH
jgi:hypothetical protein